MELTARSRYGASDQVMGNGFSASAHKHGTFNMFPTRAGRAEKVQKATLILIYLAIMSHCALEAAASRQGHAHHITETVNGIDNGTGRTGMLNEHLAAAWSQDVS